MRRIALLCLLLFVPALAGAFDGLLLHPDGSPAAGYQVSVVGRPISVTADGEGRFRISPDPVLPFQIEQIGRPDRLAGQPPAGRGDRRDTPPRRLHPPHPDPQQVLPAVSRLPREVRRLDPPALQKPLESRDHVQDTAS